MRSATFASACAAFCVFAFASVSAATEPQADAAPSVPTAATVAPSAAPSRDPLGELLETLPDVTSEWPYEEREPGARTRVGGKPAAQRVVVPPAPPPGDLWVRIRRGFRIPDLETKLAENRTLWYANQPDYFDRMAQRSSRYLYHIVEEIERRDMPTELALLPFVESAFVRGGLLGEGSGPLAVHPLDRQELRAGAEHVARRATRRRRVDPRRARLPAEAVRPVR